MEREFECRGKKYRLTLFPASIEDENGDRNIVTEQNAKKLSKMLIKLVINGSNVFLGSENGISVLKTL